MTPKPQNSFVPSNPSLPPSAATGPPNALPPVEVTLTAVTKKYGHGAPQVLRDLNLRVLTGEFLAVVGPSGCGKSTLLNLIGGLDRPDSGDIRVAGKSLAGLNDRDLSAFRNRMVGFIFQTYHLHPRMTALENVMLPGLIAGQTADQAREAARATLARLAMGAYADKMPRALSGGQMQRVAIARALALSPRILLADEPTGNLDERAGQELLELIANLNRTEKLTALLVTHEARVQRYASRSVAMENGALIS